MAPGPSRADGAITAGVHERREAEAVRGGLLHEAAPLRGPQRAQRGVVPGERVAVVDPDHVAVEQGLGAALALPVLDEGGNLVPALLGHFRDLLGERARSEDDEALAHQPIRTASITVSCWSSESDG
jgi:hypothetical protein